MKLLFRIFTGLLLVFAILCGSGIAPSAYNLIQANGTPAAIGSTLNFANNTGITWTATTSGAVTTVTPTLSSSGGGAGITIYNGSTTIIAAGTTFFPVGGSTAPGATESVVQNPAPSAASIADLFIFGIQPPGTGDSVSFTWRKNGVDTALTCTISGAVATSCNDTTHTITVAAGDLVDIEMTATGTFVSLSYFISESTVFGATSAPGVQKYSQSFSSVTSVVLTDNLNTTVKTTQCYDSASPPNQIIPANVAITDANDVTVTFSSSQSGSCIVQG